MALDAGIAPQNLSLMRVFQPRIRALEQHLQQRLRELEELSTWDPNTVSHGALLVSIRHLRQEEEGFRRTQAQLMQALWLEQAKRYNAYRNTVSTTLRRRHKEELAYLFHDLRIHSDIGAFAAPRSPGKGDEPKGKEQLATRDFLKQLGYRFSRNKRLLETAERQMKERAAFDKCVARHTAALQEGQDADLGRLAKALKRTRAMSDQLVVVTEKKITASHQATLPPTVYRRKERPAAPPAAQPAADGIQPSAGAQFNTQAPAGEGAPTGSALDRPAGGQLRPGSGRRSGSSGQGEGAVAVPPAAVTAAPAAAGGDEPDEYDRELRDILNQATAFQGSGP